MNPAYGRPSYLSCSSASSAVSPPEPRNVDPEKQAWSFGASGHISANKLSASPRPETERNSSPAITSAHSLPFQQKTARGVIMAGFQQRWHLILVSAG